MRLACPEERLDCLPIGEVTLNLDCRDEIIPILRALQHLYGDARCGESCWLWWARMSTASTDRKRGRRGMNYWEIAVLARRGWAAIWITTSCKTWRKTIAACGRSWASAIGKRGSRLRLAADRGQPDQTAARNLARRSTT